jgi:hypothetical protein
LSKIAAKRSSMRRREFRAKRSASSTGVRSAGFRVTIRWALDAVAEIANSSAPISTRRPRTACRFSSLGPNRIMAWNSARASFLERRST